MEENKSTAITKEKTEVLKEAYIFASICSTVEKIREAKDESKHLQFNCFVFYLNRQR